MHKFKLELEDDYSFLLYGISCHLKDYRVAWHLNKQLRLDFVRNTVSLSIGKGEVLEFSIYKSEDYDHCLNYYLLDNYSDGIPLIKSLKQYDFFIIVEGAIDLFDQAYFSENLREITHLQMVAEEDPEVLVKYQYLLFEK